ncbi:hypothetical protein ACTXMY_15020 [Glutamicibacter ardleyensis]|uniref:hypothetical protein n=1 Tax=Glutamicibacter ardleyensis TaxID=225894 RepID=UPI003FD68A6F
MLAGIAPCSGQGVATARHRMPGSAPRRPGRQHDHNDPQAYRQQEVRVEECQGPVEFGARGEGRERVLGELTSAEERVPVRIAGPSVGVCADPAVEPSDVLGGDGQ